MKGRIFGSYFKELRIKRRLTLRQFCETSGFDPGNITIPRRFTEVSTGKGAIDTSYLNSLKTEYAKRIAELVNGGEKGSDPP